MAIWLDMGVKEDRIKSIVKLYYSKPEIQNYLLEFGRGREVVPSYMGEAYGRRPDALQYPSDVIGAVNKGATSFHCSEELWSDPLGIDSEMSLRELSDLRNGWDLLIDIDSPYLDYSKIAARLILDELENQGVKNYGIKFSGSKGFHLIIPWKAFSNYVGEEDISDMFPEWPRAICQYILFRIRGKYNEEVSKMEVNFEALKERTNLSKEDVMTIVDSETGESAKEGKIAIFVCPICDMRIERPNMKITNRKLKCPQDTCAGVLDLIELKDYFYTEGGASSFDKFSGDQERGSVILSKDAKGQDFKESFKQEISGEKMASLDLVLVASRHLFRMPYSLHEKTGMASVVIGKEDIENFNPKMADPLGVKIKDFMPECAPGEGGILLENARAWKKIKDEAEGVAEKNKYSDYKPVDMKGVSEDMFPAPINKLLKGVKDGKKRGLFILLTFLKSVGFNGEKIVEIVQEWNKKNEQPLKEGYVRSQISWHMKQKKQILPPNYSNDNFYKDLELLDKEPKTKNPVADVSRALRRKQGGSGS